MNFETIPEINYLFHLSSRGWKLGLEKIRQMMAELGNPHDKYPTVHIAGTNGKGSTSVMLNAMLVAAGLKTGLFTSPHLIEVTERIRCNDQQISVENLQNYIRRLKPFFEKYQCTFFEALTAIGFVYFADQHVDIAVIEVGLGGRLDATNVLHPALAIITDIEHDHVQHLGRSREKITYEKAGIIKPNGLCLTNTRHKVVRRILDQVCTERHAQLICAPDIARLEHIHFEANGSRFDYVMNGSMINNVEVALPGEHQVQNAALAVTAAHLLRKYDVRVDDEAVRRGLKNVSWPGRLQRIAHQPDFILDVAHNANGAQRLKESIQRLYPGKKATILMGICKHKNYRAMLRHLNEIAANFIFVKANTHRALPTRVLHREAEQYGKAIVEFQSVARGVDYAGEISTVDGLILGTGSHYTVGEILKYYKNA